MKRIFRMKQLISALLTAILLIAMMPAAFASGCSMNPTGEHLWGSWETTVSATCSRSGEKERVCRLCRAKDTESTGKKKHSYGSWKVKREATCDKKGERVRSCNVCGYEDKEAIKKKPHSWGEWTVITEPTDRSAGLREHTCEVCQTPEQETFYPEGTLKRGDKGDAVKTLQELLNDAGYSCGKADGAFGKKTEKAVKQYEVVIGIEQDGIAWPYVLDSLQPAKTASTRTMSNGPEREVSVVFTKYDSSVPENGHGYYEEGETVTFGFIIINNADPDSEMPVMMDVEVIDDMIKPAEEGAVAEFASIVPGEQTGGDIEYVVTAEDVQRGMIANTAMLYWHYANADQTEVGSMQSAASDTVYVYTTPYTEQTVFLELMIADTPENGEYYVENEEIEYLLRLTNSGEEPINNVEIFDPLDEGSDFIIATAAAVKPGKTLEARASHTVTADDTLEGEFINAAWASWDDDTVYSDAVSARTAPEKESHSVKLSDTVFVNTPYDTCFEFHNLIEGFGTPEFVGSNLEEIGLSCENDPEGGVRVYGTPTETGTKNCVYTMIANGELWEIEIEITVETTKVSLYVSWGIFKDGLIEHLGDFEQFSTDYTLPDTKLPNHVFVGWYTSKGRLFFKGQPLKEDTVLHPIYVFVDQVEISFDMSVWDPQPPITVVRGSTDYTLPMPEDKDGCEFTGWRVLSKGGRTFSGPSSPLIPFTPGEPVSEDITLLAMYRLTDGYSITFNAGEDCYIQGTSSQTITVKTDTNGRLSSYPTAESPDSKMTFEGWYTADYVRVDQDLDRVYGGDITLFALWSRSPTVSW